MEYSNNRLLKKKIKNKTKNHEPTIASNIGGHHDSELGIEANITSQELEI